MVVQRTINNLKERPKHERKAVASSIAIGLIIILLVAWAILFFHRIQSAVQNSDIQNTPPSATDTFESHSQPQSPQTNQFQAAAAAATSTTIQLNSTTY